MVIDVPTFSDARVCQPCTQYEIKLLIFQIRDNIYYANSVGLSGANKESSSS